ncbi:hypothetical protein WMY93_015874 [Mugilogobius chulae]|uniref:Small ribosomal subunit protein uS14 n=3 Tax=Clupeocephala TaxID=186625 RepID=A0AAW0NSG1_9GOBI
MEGQSVPELRASYRERSVPSCFKSRLRHHKLELTLGPQSARRCVNLDEVRDKLRPCVTLNCACASSALPFRRTTGADNMGHQQLYWSHPRKFGQGSRSCRVCSNRHGLIRKYGLNMCRQCFRQYAKDIGFVKAMAPVAWREEGEQKRQTIHTGEEREPETQARREKDWGYTEHGTNEEEPATKPRHSAGHETGPPRAIREHHEATYTPGQRKLCLRRAEPHLERTEDRAPDRRRGNQRTGGRGGSQELSTVTLYNSRGRGNPALSCRLKKCDRENSPSDSALRDQLLLGLRDGPLAQALKVHARRNPDQDFAALAKKPFCWTLNMAHQHPR